MEAESCIRLLVPFDLGPSLRASGAPEEGAPHLAGAPNLEDEEQPCCSKALPAYVWRPAAIDGEGPPQAAPGTPSEEDEDSDQEEFVRCHGLGSHKYTLDVELSSGNGRRLLLDTCAPLLALVGALPGCPLHWTSLATGPWPLLRPQTSWGREWGGTSKVGEGT